MNRLAHAVASIATGERQDVAADGKDPATVSLGHRRGLKGGVVRAKKLSAEQRSAIAKRAAQVRYGKKR